MKAMVLFSGGVDSTNRTGIGSGKNTVAEEVLALSNFLRTKT